MLRFIIQQQELPTHLKDICQTLKLTILSSDQLSLLDSQEPILIYNQDQLALAVIANNKIKSRLSVDFLSASNLYRQKHGQLRKSGLAKSVLSKNCKHPLVLDATAGLGSDSFDLINLGCQVIMLERNPIIYHLLLDGVTRWQKSLKTESEQKQLQLLPIDFLNSDQSVKSAQHPDIVYLDPMFPERTKSALVKKDARWLQTVVGPDLDSDQLLAKALRTARKRVVVKRPLQSPPLADSKPDYVIRGKTVRFDIYNSC